MQATISCPDLFCPFPRRLHALVHEADAHTTAWVHKYRLAASEAAWETYHDQKFTWMVARMFPDAPLFSLCIASDFNTLLFLWDDHLDALAPNAFNTGFERMAHQMMQILETGQTFPLETGGPLLAAMSDIWQRMRQISQRPWQMRFARSLKQAFAANLWRIKHVNRAQHIPLKDYLRFRPQIGGANFFLDLATLMGAIRLPADLRSNPQVRSLGLYCSRTICWANDLYSFPKEYEGGDELNLVMLLKHHQQLTLEQAVEQAVKIHNSEVALFNNTAEVLTAVCAPAAKPMLEQYIQALGQMMKGNIDWSSQDTTRYQYVYA